VLILPKRVSATTKKTNKQTKKTPKKTKKSFRDLSSGELLSYEA